MDVLKTISTRVTPQSQKARPEQIQNAAGGYTFAVNDEARLRRFLTLGTDGGTYYTNAATLTQDNADVIFWFAENRADFLIETIVEISDAGRAPKNDPCIFALAVACARADEIGRRNAFSALPLVCRTSAHLFKFCSYVENFRGWGKGLQRAVLRWYLEKPADKLAYQVLKYRQREGWSQPDPLRLAHNHVRGQVPTPDQKLLFNYVCGRGTKDITGEQMPGSLPALVHGFESVQAATKVESWLECLRLWPSLSWEMLPDAALNEPAVWEALLHNGVPMTALIRQLPRLTRIGVVTDKMGSATTQLVVKQLGDQEHITRSRIHPINALVALRTYASGRGVQGRSVWTPSRKIIDALDKLFYLAYGNVEPANKRTLLALDVSGSMTTQASGLPISCREATAAIALVTANVEPEYQIVAFSQGLVQLAISPRQRLDDILTGIDRMPFSRTDCALPMIGALQNKLPVDTFVILTDNETWYGAIHPHQALEQYRQKMGIDSRLVVVAMTATGNSIADPKDARQIDISGFDSAVPQLISAFSAGLV